MTAANPETYAKSMTERQLMDGLIADAKQRGLLVYHTFDSRHSETGFPDLVIVNPVPGSAVLVFETKRQDGIVPAAQLDWLSALSCRPIVAAIVRPVETNDAFGYDQARELIAEIAE